MALSPAQLKLIFATHPGGRPGMGGAMPQPAPSIPGIQGAATQRPRDPQGMGLKSIWSMMAKKNGSPQG